MPTKPLKGESHSRSILEPGWKKRMAMFPHERSDSFHSAYVLRRLIKAKASGMQERELQKLVREGFTRPQVMAALGKVKFLAKKIVGMGNKVALKVACHHLGIKNAQDIRALRRLMYLQRVELEIESKEHPKNLASPPYANEIDAILQKYGARAQHEFESVYMKAYRTVAMEEVRPHRLTDFLKDLK